jgi:hypothetical protein
MARYVDLEWVETDQRIINLYDKYIATVGGPGTTNTAFDATGVGDYRMQEGKGDKFDVEGKAPAKDVKPNEQGFTVASKSFSLRLDLADDMDWEVSSEFGEFGEMFSALTPLLNSAGKIFNLGTGQSANILNVFQTPTWQKTNPLSFTINAVLYTRTNGFVDVLLPAISLMSQTAIKVGTDTNGNPIRFFTPGVYLGNIGKATSVDAAGQKPKTAGSTDDANTKPQRKQPDELVKSLVGSSGFVKVRIPGLIHLGFALVTSCKPKWSKQVTESGAPLWVSLEMKFMSTVPANSDMFLSEFTKQDGSNFFTGIQSAQPPASNVTQRFSRF